MKIGITKKALYISVIFLLLLIAQVYSNTIPFLKYVDEVCFVLCAFGLLYKCFLNIKIQKITKDVLIGLMVICILGLAGNLLSRVQTYWFAIVVDITSVLKILFVFVYLLETLTPKDAKIIICLFDGIAKIFLISATVFGIVSLFYDMGMGGEIRFGMAAYNFIFRHAHVLGIYAMSCLLIIVANDNKAMVINFYTILTCICEVLTTKGPSLIWVFMIFFLFRYYVHHKKLNLWSLVMIIMTGIILGGYQINNYLMNMESPRMLFLIYGFITAKNYFPFGAGFATFGSDMASEFYSSLYVLYGFSYRYGLSQTRGSYLNDNYWPMIMGQFGFAAVLIMGMIYFLIFRLAQKRINAKVLKACVISNYIYIMIHALGSATPTSAEGMILFVVIALAICKCQNNEKSVISTYSTMEV